MKKIDLKNFQDFEPIELSDLISGNKAQIVETSISGLIEIGTYIARAIANGPRAKRIQALENFMKHQALVNEQYAKEIIAIKTKIGI
jgi:hypothetical protein